MPARSPQPRGASISFSTMGTVAHAAWGPADLEIGQRLAERAARIESRLTRFRPDSEISMLGTRWHEVSDDTAAVLRAARDLESASDGAFTVMAGERMRAWEQATSGAAPPGAAAVEGRVEITGESGRLARARLVGAGAGAVDLGGIAKGYAADHLRDLAIELGASDVLISYGSSSIAVAGAPVRVGIASPWRGWDTVGTLTLHRPALSVSADPGTRIGPGRRRSHVLDPATGAPALTDLCAVVVTGDDGMVCEALSTACLALKLAGALRLDQAHPEVASLFMTRDGRLLADGSLDLVARPGLTAWLRAQRTAAAAPVRDEHRAPAPGHDRSTRMA